MTTIPPGRWLEAKFRERDLDTRAIAAATGVSTQAVYQWFSGKTKPGEHAADQVAELLDIPAVEVRYRFGLDIPEWVTKEARWRREVKRYAELVDGSKGPPRQRTA